MGGNKNNAVTGLFLIVYGIIDPVATRRLRHLIENMGFGSFEDLSNMMKWRCIIKVQSINSQ